MKAKTVRSREDALLVITQWRSQTQDQRQTALDAHLVPDNKKLIGAALAVWAIESGISWRTFTRPSWKKVLELMHCSIGLGDHMRREVFPQMSSLMHKYLAARLSERCVVSCTSDSWSRSDMSLASLTISWIDRSTMALHTVPVAAGILENGTADTIQALWQRVLQHGPLPESVVVGAMTTDSGANFVCAARRFVGDDSKWSCLCHALNNICDKATKATGSQLFQRIETFLAWLPKRLRKSFKDFQKAQGDEPLSFVRTVPTRWLTNYSMADRYLKLADKLEQFVQHSAAASEDVEAYREMKVRMLSADEIHDLQTVLYLLHPFQVVSTKAESDSKPTLCFVPQWLDDLRRHITADAARDSGIVSHWKQALRRECAALFHLVFETPSLPLRAACFHPSIGNLPWVSAHLRDEVWEKVVTDIIEIQPVVEADSATELSCTTTVQDIRNDVQRLRTLLERNHDSITSKYGDDAQQFWLVQSRDPRNTLLVDAARFFLSIQASSTSSERLWSSATFTHKHRPQLSPANLEATVVLRGCLKMESGDINAVFKELMKIDQ